MTNLIRVSKLMADRGLCSRREADEFIRRQWVKVDGHIVTLGQRAAPEAKIELHPDANAQLKQQVTILLNKPVGYVSGQAEHTSELQSRGHLVCRLLLEKKKRR